MTDLQLALIALGAIIIAGVVVYNWLQERKLRQNITEEFLVPQKDVLAENFYIDADAYVDKALENSPAKSRLQEVLNQPSEVKPTPALAPEAEVDEQDEPVMSKQETVEPIQASTPTNQAHVELNAELQAAFPVEAKVAEAKEVAQEDSYQIDAVDLPKELHPQIDLTAFLYLTKPITKQRLNPLVAELDVPVMTHTLDANNKWLNLNEAEEQGTFKQLACSLQLADRSGPVSKSVLNKFQFEVENLGLELAAHVEWQGTGDAMQRAIELDKFCLEVDQLVSVHLIAGEAAVHGTKFRGLAEASGLVLANDGRFHFHTQANGEVLFTLASTDNQAFTADGLRNQVIKSATFQLEIPKVTQCDQAFNQMIVVAQKMANSLGARMVDDNQKPLGDLQIEKIRQQLKVIHATMVARGVLPGSPSSERLFN